MKKFLCLLPITPVIVLFAIFTEMAVRPVWAALKSEADGSLNIDGKTFTTVIEAKLRKESPKTDLIFELESFEQDDQCFTKTITAKLDGNIIATLHTEKEVVTRELKNGEMSVVNTKELE